MLGMKIDRADTAWVVVSAALGMLMTPALAFFYAGLFRLSVVLLTGRLVRRRKPVSASV